MMQGPFTKVKGSKGWHKLAAMNEKEKAAEPPIEPKLENKILYKIDQINKLLDEIENLKICDDKQSCLE